MRYRELPPSCAGIGALKRHLVVCVAFLVRQWTGRTPCAGAGLLSLDDAANLKRMATHVPCRANMALPPCCFRSGAFRFLKDARSLTLFWFLLNATTYCITAWL